MAHFATHFSLFLLLAILFPSPQIQARFGKFYDDLPKLPFQSPSPSPIINEISQPPSGISPSPSPVFEGDISPSPVFEGDISPSPVFEGDISSPPSPIFDGEISPTPSPIFEGEISPAPSPVFEGGFSSPPSPVFEGVVSESPMQREIAPTPVETVDNAYGLYGSSDFSNEVFNRNTPEKATNNVVVDVDDDDEDNDDFPANSFNTERFKQVNNYNQNTGGFKNGGFGEKYNDNNNGGVNYNDVPVSNYNNYNQNNGYSTLPSNNNYFKNDGFSETFNDNNGVNYNDVPVANYNNKGFDNNDNENGFEGRQGMSDTRFMENGKYSYDFQNGNKNQNDVYESVNRDGNNGGGYYGDRTKYEYDSMDQYEREQGYPDNQKYYVP